LENVYILLPLEIFYGDLGYFVTIWYILYSFGTLFPVLVSWTKKNPATMVDSQSEPFARKLPICVTKRNQ
jgi:hypothetical protein